MKSKLRTLITLAAMLMLIFSLCAKAEDTLQLPKDLKIIKANTFYGSTSIDKVLVPEGVTEIQSKAFANSTLKKSPCRSPSPSSRRMRLRGAGILL